MAFTLDEVLEGKEPEVTEEPAKETTEEVEVKTETTEEVTEEVVEETTEEPTGEEGATTPVVEENTREVPIGALLDERDKRKDAVARADALEKQLEEKKEAPNFWENPEATIASIKEELRAENDAKIEELKGGFKNAWLAHSSEAAAEKYGDEVYRPIAETFAKAAQTNPELVNRLYNSANMGEFIYKTGLQMQQMDESGGDLESLHNKWKAEWLAEQKAAKDTTDDKLNQVPESLTDTQSTGSPKGKVEGGPTPLGNIIRSD